MNDRIQELIKQCTETSTGFDYRFGNRTETYFDKEKFARLIISDAITTVQKRFMGDLNREDMEVRRCVEDLKQHFGVE